MIITTLNDHLLYHGITKKEACKLFGRTPKTLKRWNEEPPEWVLRIIQLMGKKPHFPDEWEGWYFDRHWLVDPAGNSFKQNEMLSSKYNQQIKNHFTGDINTVRSLKLQLEKKIKELNSQITITVNIGNEKPQEFKIKRSIHLYQ